MEKTFNYANSFVAGLKYGHILVDISAAERGAYVLFLNMDGVCDSFNHSSPVASTVFGTSEVRSQKAQAASILPHRSTCF